MSPAPPQAAWNASRLRRFCRPLPRVFILVQPGVRAHPQWLEYFLRFGELDHTLETTRPSLSLRRNCRNDPRPLNFPSTSRKAPRAFTPQPCLFRLTVVLTQKAHAPISIREMPSKTLPPNDRHTQLLVASPTPRLHNVNDLGHSSQEICDLLLNFRSVALEDFYVHDRGTYQLGSFNDSNYALPQKISLAQFHL